MARIWQVDLGSRYGNGKAVGIQSPPPRLTRPGQSECATWTRARFVKRASRVGPRGGFTLIETALATIIVGVGVLAMVSAQQAFHRQNTWSTHAGIAAYLGNEIREMTMNLPRHDAVTGTAYWGPEPNELSLQDYDDIDDFDGTGNGLIFSAALDNGPINAQRQVIPNMPGWAQIVTVRNVDATNITIARNDASTALIEVEVVVTFQGPQDAQPVEMTRVSWISPK